MVTYKEAEEYILSIPKFAGKHTLEDTKRLLARAVGEKGIKSKVIHVAGTNGKGSVCAYLRSILMESGRSVGFFTSPHLDTMRERICLGNEMISESEFVRLFEQIMEITKQECNEGGSHPSFFEFLFLMAMVYFREKEPDYVILETGLGGRLDATSSVENPVLCMITEIGYDHMQYLGSSIEEIAAEKAGIIRGRAPVVFVDRRKESTEVLAEYAKRAESPAIMIRKDDILDVNINNKTIDFSLNTGYYKYVSLSLGTAALYQTENASLAVRGAEALRDGQITEETIRRGLRVSFWPGRMEEVLPGVYLDGAHNEDGVRAFLEAVRVDGCEGRRLLLFGVSADKRYGEMIGLIAGADLFAEVAATELETDRSASVDRLRENFAQYREISCSFHEHLEDAFLSLWNQRQEGDYIYIAGSLYMAGPARALIRRTENDRF